MATRERSGPRKKAQRSEPPHSRKYADGGTDYSQNWNKDHDPTLGRCIQAGPIGLSGDVNRFAHVGDTPLSEMESAGLETYMCNKSPLLFISVGTVCAFKC